MTGQTTSIRVVGVIPAAGASQRMGRAKALLTLEGSTFLRRAVTSLSKGGCDPVLVVATEDAADIAAEAESCGATVLLNPEPGEGPVTSLRIAISALDSDVDAIAFLPVDHPLVRPQTVRDLLHAAAASQAALTLPVFEEKRGHPAIFNRTLFADLLDPALEGGARTVVHRHLGTAHVVPCTDPGVVADIDTPAEYAAVAESMGSISE